MKKLWFGIAGIFIMATLGFAQDGHDLSAILAKHWQTSKELTLAVIDKMPEDQFSFKASSAEMSFGEMAAHIAGGNNNYCAITPGAAPPEKSKDFTKAAVTKQVSDSFDFCMNAIKNMADSDLMKMTGKAPRQTTVFERFWGGFTHTAHHRAQLEVYLRLKGITPPQYKF